MSKTSPGPWRMYGVRKLGEAGIIDVNVLTDASGTVIAEHFNNADGVLMCHAIEMLELLRELRSALGVIATTGDGRRCRDLADEARVRVSPLLARIEGGT